MMRNDWRSRKYLYSEFLLLEEYPMLLSVALMTWLIFILSIASCLCWKIVRELRQSFSGYGIPFIVTPDYKLEQLLDNLTLAAWDTFIDIGCGDGKVLETVERKFPGVLVIGYELSQEPFLLAEKRKKEKGLSYTLHHTDFFDADIAHATVFYSYMISYMMDRIWKKVSNECRPGTLLYSSSFSIPGTEPTKILEVSPTQQMYVYSVTNVSCGENG